jgi:very-short-patch-repair endonuclease
LIIELDGGQHAEQEASKYERSNWKSMVTRSSDSGTMKF